MVDFPDKFVDYCHEHFKEDAKTLLAHLNDVPPVSLRINRKKMNALDLPNVDWCSSGYYLEERPTFTEDPLFHAGCYYVQEASSMLIQNITQLINPEEQLIILDLCAAPGGKTTLLLDLFPKALIVANEIIPKRAKILAENVTKWGSERVIVTNATPEQISDSGIQFDLILVDAPCSGEGMFRKDPNARDEWSVENVEQCEIRQKDIIDTINSSLKPNGTLIYSTCTFNHHENEENVQHFITEHGFSLLDITTPENVQKTDYGYRMWPHKIKGEGFFASFLRKEATISNFTRSKKAKLPKTLTSPSKEELGILNSILNLEGAKNILCFMDTYHWFPEGFHENISLLISKKVRIIHFGHPLGKLIKNKFIPDPCFHYHPDLWDNFPSINIDQEQAVKFLKKEDIQLADEAENGWNMLVFNRKTIGLVKVINQRINNYYPKEWRIINPQINHHFSVSHFEKA